MINKLLFIAVTTLLGFFYVGPNNGYSVLLPEGTQLVQIDSLDNDIVNHTFLIQDNINHFELTMSISVVESEFKNLILQEGIDKYEEDCDCNIVKTEKVQFPNFNGVRYSIVKKIDGIDLGGEVYISEGMNGKSINVVSMSLKHKSEYLTENLEPILKTLVLNW